MNLFALAATFSRAIIRHRTNSGPAVPYAEPAAPWLIDKVPHGHWQTTTFVAALRHDRIDAPCLFDGPINGERFLAYVNEELAPTLNKDDIVVADNLGSHKSKAVRQAIRNAGARLIFLPKYSPDLSPIEPSFSKLKGALRKAEARTVDGLWRHAMGGERESSPAFRGGFSV